MRVRKFVVTVWLTAILPSTVIASAIHGSHSLSPRGTNQESAPLLQIASQEDIQKAREMVDKAFEESAKLNQARIDHPTRNSHKKPGSRLSRRGRAIPVSPLLDITPELSRAAALVAEAEAAGKNSSAILNKRGTFWMQDIERRGTSPWGSDPDYKIFRNVQDYGAKGDGLSDDTDAINKAIMDGKRCGEKCNGSTLKNAIVYFPPGTYLVHKPIISVFGTQIIGDYNNRPTIKATKRFLGLGVISTDEYVGNGAGTDGKDNEWYVNTANFYRSIRNIKVDITDIIHGNPICAFHYQVAQATSMHNIEITAKPESTQRGIYAENGSGGLLSDIVVNGGAYGLFGGAQQFTALRMTFNKCKTAIQLIWDWGWMWKGLRINDCKIGMRLVSEDATGNIGSVTLADAVFKNGDKGVVVDKVSEETGSGTTGLVMDVVRFDNVDKAVVDLNDTVLWDGQGSNGRWHMGPAYDDDLKRAWVKTNYPDEIGQVPDHIHGGDPSDQTSTGYFSYQRQQYADKSPSDFIHLKDFAAGDGKTDDTAGVQKAIDSAGDKIIFADAGIYLISNTILIPQGTRIVGEAWTQFAATGKGFGDATRPKVMFRVGTGEDPDPGTGDQPGNPAASKPVEMQDIIFTSKGPTPGVILLQWYAAYDQFEKPSAMWDCHARLGGATGTDLTPAECPALKTGEVKDECKVASMMMEVPRGGAGYFENVWLWVADHMIDDPDLDDDKNEMTMISVYSARGMLVQSEGPVWLYGTASEHSVMYQYNFHNAVDVYAGLLQTESPYYQPSPTPPTPFANQKGLWLSDPDYSRCSGASGAGCDSSWGLIITNSTNVVIASSGIYSWFSTFSEDCIDGHQCQQALVKLERNHDRVLLTNLVTIGANNSVFSDNGLIPAIDNLAVKSHPSWSQISYLSGKSNPFSGDKAWDFVECDSGPLLLQSNLEALVNHIDDYWLPCAPVWAVRILYRDLADAIGRYYDEDGDNYDEKFKTYESHLKDKIGPAIEKAMSVDGGECNQFFECSLVVHEQGKPDSAPWVKTCPFTRIDLLSYDKFTMTYTLKDEAGFNKTISEKYGVMPEWVKLANRSGSNKASPGHAATSFELINEPTKADNIHIINPKDAISKSLDGYKTLMSTLLAARVQLGAGSWQTAETDPMSAYVLPVGMVTDAVKIMSDVARIGQEEIDADREKFIMTIVNVVLLVLPFAGELVGPLIGLTALIGRIITLIDVAGQGAVAFYDLAAHPDDAAMSFLGLMVGVGGVVKGFGREAEDMEHLMTLRRGIKLAEIEKMGVTAKRNSELLSTMANKCYRKE